MNRQRFAILAVAALVVLCGAWYLTGRRDQPQGTQVLAFLPSLAGELNAVNAVIVRKGSATVTVHKTGTEWTVAERADYPADVGKIRTLLLALRDARIVEQKTSDPARFASIGVQDPAAGTPASGAPGADSPAAGVPGASQPAAESSAGASAPLAASTEITLLGPAQKLAVIVGKPTGEGNFMRRAGENSTYSVEPAISAETAPRSWIDSRLLDLTAALIQRVDVKPAAGAQAAPHAGQVAASAPYSLLRQNPADSTYTLEGVPQGRRALDGAQLAPGPTTFTGLTAEDVAPAGEIDFTRPSQVIVTLSDGNIVTLTGTVVGDAHWIEIQSSKDAALTAKVRGRAFEIASYRYDAIFKPLEQLLVPNDTPAAGAPGAGPGPGPGLKEGGAAGAPAAGAAAPAGHTRLRTPTQSP